MLIDEKELELVKRNTQHEAFKDGLSRSLFLIFSEFKNEFGAKGAASMLIAIAMDLNIENELKKSLLEML